MEEFGSKVVVPVDVALDFGGSRKEVTISTLPTDYPIFDIGTKPSRTTPKSSQMPNSISC
jgi:3-phosphoglycerate kinase